MSGGTMFPNKRVRGKQPAWLSVPHYCFLSAVNMRSRTLNFCTIVINIISFQFQFWRCSFGCSFVWSFCGCEGSGPFLRSVAVYSKQQQQQQRQHSCDTSSFATVCPSFGREERAGGSNGGRRMREFKQEESKGGGGGRGALREGTTRCHFLCRLPQAPLAHL